MKVHLDCRPIWRFAHPDVKVFAFSGFEEEHVVAIIKFSKLVELIELGFGVEFCIFAAVREESVNIVEKMSLAV